MGAGSPAKQAARCMAPAAPVFAAKAAPTGFSASLRRTPNPLWERASPRSRRRGAWQLPQRPRSYWLTGSASINLAIIPSSTSACSRMS
ncbi:hypothetical protein C6A77_04895 [Pseudomonas sp. AFG_SD02_1510_Pfu_092]|nr:hypothetical protein C6A77_04895 [Pseudomonas sp. AFG_SD02_1510_Pfu_092]